MAGAVLRGPRRVAARMVAPGPRVLSVWQAQYSEPLQKVSAFVWQAQCSERLERVAAGLVAAGPAQCSEPPERVGRDCCLCGSAVRRPGAPRPSIARNPF